MVIIIYAVRSSCYVMWSQNCFVYLHSPPVQSAMSSLLDVSAQVQPCYISLDGIAQYGEVGQKRSNRRHPPVMLPTSGKLHHRNSPCCLLCSPWRWIKPRKHLFLWLAVWRIRQPSANVLTSARDTLAVGYVSLESEKAELLINIILLHLTGIGACWCGQLTEHHFLVWVCSGIPGKAEAEFRVHSRNWEK